MEDEGMSIFTNPDMEVASVLAVNISATTTIFRHQKSGSQSLPTFTTRSNSEPRIKQSPFRPATVLTNLTRGNVATLTPTFAQPHNVHQLAGQGELEVLKVMLSNVDEADGNGFTPLMWACSNNQLRTAKYLVENGADVNYKGNCQETALLMACNKGYDSVVKYLLNDCNCGITDVDKSGNSALIYAVNGNHVKCVQTLLSQSVDVNHRNIEGLSAFDIAVNSKHFEIQKELEKYLLLYFDNCS